MGADSITEGRTRAWRTLGLDLMALAGASCASLANGSAGRAGPLEPARPRAFAAAAVLALAQLAGIVLLAPDGWRRRPARPSGVGVRSKARAIRHFDERAERYDRLVSRGPLRLLRVRERQAVLHLAALDDPSKRTVIDVGCGGGFYSRAAKRAGKWVHAVDAAPAMVRRVRPDVDVAEVADIETFAPARTYDVVICCGVLDFVARPERAFDNLCRLCAPGGRLVVLLPRAGAGSVLYRLEKRLQRLDVNFYQRTWLVRRARRRGLVLADARHPLPFNMALLFESVRTAEAGRGHGARPQTEVRAEPPPTPDPGALG